MLQIIKSDTEVTMILMSGNMPGVLSSRTFKYYSRHLIE